MDLLPSQNWWLSNSAGELQNWPSYDNGYIKDQYEVQQPQSVQQQVRLNNTSTRTQRRRMCLCLGGLGALAVLLLVAFALTFGLAFDGGDRSETEERKQVYAPTSESTEEEIDAFHDKLEEAKSHCKSDEIQLIMGDLNAKVGQGQDGKTVDPTVPVPLIVDPELSLSIDSNNYFLGDEATIIDNEDHVLQCSATNVHPGSTLTWDFGDNVVQGSRWTVTSLDRGNGLIDLFSTVNVVGIAQGANNAITCFLNDPLDGRRKRQAGDAFVRVNIVVRGESVGQSLTLRVGRIGQTSIPYNTGAEILLDEGLHIFECIANGAELNTVLAWEFDGKVVVPDDVDTRFQGSVQTIESTIRNYQVSEDDCGISVRCFILSTSTPNAVEGSLTIEVEIFVRTVPHSIVLSSTCPSCPVRSLPFNPTTRTVTVYEGVDVEFTCQAVGTEDGSDVTLTFTLDNENVDTGTGNILSPSLSRCEEYIVERTFELSPIYEDHHGITLQCSAVNAAGESLNPAVVDVNLNVEELPQNLEMEIDSVLVTGTETIIDVGFHDIKCSSDLTHPVSTLSWTLAGREVTTDAFGISTTGDDSSTAISSTRYLDSTNCNTFIECTATNDVVAALRQSSLSTSTTLYVNTPPSQVEISLASGVGSITNPFGCTPAITLIHGLTYTFDCTITGADAEADVSWTLTRLLSNTATEEDAASTNDVDCNSQTDVESFTFVADYTKHQYQTLTCDAANSAGSVNQSVAITVQVAPTTTDLSLMVNTNNYADQATINVIDGRYILKGDSLDFECQVSGADPTATVSWDIEGVTSDGSTTTRSITASSTATCTAHNAVSSDSDVGGPVTQQVNLVVDEPQDCYEILDADSQRASGVYWIYPIIAADSTKVPMQVYCDMETDGGGWTVFQRRVDGSENFFRDWETYKAGFGNLEVEYWLGNHNIYAITNNGKNYHLRVDLDDGMGDTTFVKYNAFDIDTEANNYQLTLGAEFGSGGAGVSLKMDHDGQDFSTFDVDNDNEVFSCGERHKGGWWYDNCHHANLNGLYYTPGTYTNEVQLEHDMIIFNSWKGWQYSLAGSVMMVRPGATVTP